MDLGFIDIFVLLLVAGVAVFFKELSKMLDLMASAAASDGAALTSFSVVIVDSASCMMGGVTGAGVETLSDTTRDKTVGTGISTLIPAVDATALSGTAGASTAAVMGSGMGAIEKEGSTDSTVGGVTMMI